jgi:hypothetical protein
MKPNALYNSTKNNITYACVSIGQNYIWDKWEYTQNKWVRTPTIIQCGPEQVVMLEIIAWGKPKVFNKADIEKAIEEKTINLVQN